MYEPTAEKLCSLISDVFTLVDFFEQKDKSYSDATFSDLLQQMTDSFVKLPPTESNWKVVDSSIMTNFRTVTSTPSDMRYFVVNLVAIFFKYYGRVAPPNDKGYNAIWEWRGGGKDAAFVQDKLLEIILADRTRNMSYQLKKLFISLLAGFMNRFGGQNPMFDNISRSEVSLITHEIQLFSLYRRYLEEPDRLQDENSFESISQKSDYFVGLAKTGHFARRLLADIGYLKRESFLKKVLTGIVTALSRFAPLFVNGKYLAYYLRTGKAVYLFLLIWLVIIFAATIGHTMYWKNENKKLYQTIEKTIKTP